MKKTLTLIAILFTITCYSQDSLCVLPVTFTSIKVNVDSRICKIEWQTENEINHDHYEVEKSFDSKTFTKVSTVQPNTFRYYYSYVEIEKPMYLRVKQVDRDNRHSYSKTVFANIANLGASVAPNPFKGELNVSVYVKNKSTYKLAIRNLNQQLVSVKSLLLSPGNNFIKIITDSVPPGIYVVSISNAERVLLTQKIVK